MAICKTCHFAYTDTSLHGNMKCPLCESKKYAQLLELKTAKHVVKKPSAFFIDVCTQCEGTGVVESKAKGPYLSMPCSCELGKDVAAKLLPEQKKHFQQEYLLKPPSKFDCSDCDDSGWKLGGIPCKCKMGKMAKDQFLYYSENVQPDILCVACYDSGVVDVDDQKWACYCEKGCPVVQYKQIKKPKCRHCFDTGTLQPRGPKPVGCGNCDAVAKKQKAALIQEAFASYFEAVKHQQQPSAEYPFPKKIVNVHDSIFIDDSPAPHKEEEPQGPAVPEYGRKLDLD